MENLDETSSPESFLEVDEENSSVLIGEPPWGGKDKIDYLIYLTFNACEKNNTEEINTSLKFLVKQSVYKDVKLFLLRHNFLCIAKYLLENQSLPQTINYIFRITINLCYINEGIDEIGKSRGFVKAILYYLNCKRNEEIVRKILKLLRLATYEIQVNSESDWIVRFKECKFFGRRIIFLLGSSELRTGVQLIQLIRSISEINLPDEINFLEQLFDIDKLINALLTSYIYVIPKFYNFISVKEFNFIEHWLWFLTIRQMQVGIDEYINNNSFNITASYMVDYEKLHEFLVDDNFLKYIERFIKVLCRIIQMLLRFCFIEKIDITMNYLNGTFLMVLVILDQGELHLGVEIKLLLEKLKKILNQYWLHIVTHGTCQNIGFILKSLKSSDVEGNEIVKYLINCVLSDCSMTSDNEYKKMMKIIASNL